MKYRLLPLSLLLTQLFAVASVLAQVHLTLDANTAIRSSALTPANSNIIVDGLNANATHKLAASVLPTPSISGLNPTGIKTSAYTASANDYVIIDASAGNVALSFPAAPPDGTRVGFKLIAVTAPYAATLTTQSGDVLNKAGGSTSATLSLLNQGVIYQYKASGAIWYGTGSDLPLSQTDLRYPLLSGSIPSSWLGATSTRALPGNTPLPPSVDFQPSQLSGLYFWLHSGDFASLPDGTTITSANIHDRGPNNFALTVPGACTKVTGVDGRAALKFDNVTGLTLPSAFSLNRQAVSVYLVARLGANYTQDVGSAICDFGSGAQCLFWVNGGGLQIYGSAGNPSTRATRLSQSSFFLLGYRAASTATTIRYNDWTQSVGALGAGTVTGGSLGSSSGGTFGFSGEISEVLIFNRTLSDTEDAEVVACLNRPALRQQIICVGDSMTYGYASLTSYNTPLYFSYPWQLNRLVENAKVINLGVSGQTTQTLTGTMTTTAVPLVDTTTFQAGNFVLVSSGTNDIQAGRTAAQAYADLATVCGAARSAGARVIIDTVLSRGTFSGGQESIRQSYNALVRAGWTAIADALVDLDANTVLGGVGTCTNTIYFDGDTTHLTALGYKIKARAFADGITHLDASRATAFTALADGATITQACDLQRTTQAANVTLGGNRTLAITGASAGMRGTLLIKQDATGSRTLTLPAGSKVAGGGSGAVTLSTAANAVDRLQWEYDGANYYWTATANFN